MIEYKFVFRMFKEPEPQIKLPVKQAVQEYFYILDIDRLLPSCYQIFVGL